MTHGKVHKLTEIDLSELQIGEKLTIYRGSNAFLTGPSAAGYVGEATIIEVKKRSALFTIKKDPDRQFVYRLRFKDMRICRVPNGELTMLYAHARTGRPTVTAYFTDIEYTLVKKLLGDEARDASRSTYSRRHASYALERMEWHDSRRES